MLAGAAAAQPSEEYMTKVFVTVMGSRIRLGNHGEAILETVMEPDPDGGEPKPRVFEQGVFVPEEVADDLEWEMAGCPQNEDGQRDMKKGTPTRAPHSMFRIERDRPVKVPTPAPANKPMGDKTPTKAEKE